jgi:hypothetical protein
MIPSIALICQIKAFVLNNEKKMSFTADFQEMGWIMLARLVLNIVYSILIFRQIDFMLGSYKQIYVGSSKHHKCSYG